MESYKNKQIHEALLRAHNPVFISDERVDGDSLGSSLAMVDFLQTNGKSQPFVYVATAVPEIYSSLPFINRCTQNIEIFSDPTIDLVVSFDCSDSEFIKRLVALIPNAPRIINIDHHKTNTFYGDINQVIIDASATAEVVYGFFENHHLPISKDAATCLFVGLCFDTTAFTNSATNVRTLDIASKLILSGARIQDAIRMLFKNRSVAALRVWGLALERLHFHQDFDSVITCLTRKDIEENQVSEEEIEGLSNFLSLVTDTETIYVLRETSEQGVKVSMRSSTRDVSAIARANGGGGHEKAAGYTIKNAMLLCGENGCWRVERKVEK